jgi:hypothetical protein
MSDEDKKNSGMIFAGQGWTRKTRNNENMISGEIKFKLVILPNKKHVQGDNLPNVNIFIAPADREKKEEKKDGTNPEDLI